MALVGADEVVGRRSAAAAVTAVVDDGLEGEALLVVGGDDGLDVLEGYAQGF